MNINLELYKVFYTVAKLGNITAASRELAISQPAISKSVKTLEQQLGGKLFIRTQKGVLLTTEGAEFFNYVRQGMEHIENAERRFNEHKNLETGHIKIGVESTANLILPYLKEFHEKYPKVSIEITHIKDKIIEKLESGIIDIAITDVPKGKTNLDIIKTHIINEVFFVGKPLAGLANKELTLQELNNYPLILPVPGLGGRTFLDDFAKDYSITLKPAMEPEGVALIAELTAIGLGIGYGSPKRVAQEMKDGKLIPLNVTPKIPSRHMCISLSKTNKPSFCVSKLVEIIKKSS